MVKCFKKGGLITSDYIFLFLVNKRTDLWLTQIGFKGGIHITQGTGKIGEFPEGRGKLKVSQSSEKKRPVSSLEVSIWFRILVLK